MAFTFGLVETEWPLHWDLASPNVWDLASPNVKAIPFPQKLGTGKTESSPKVYVAYNAASNKKLF
jgi:hypothetical protein